MDKKTLYEKTERAINQAFEVTKQSVKVFSEKAGEAAHITKLLIDKATLEHRVSKKLSQLGSQVYEKAQKKGVKVTFDDAEIRDLIEETKKLELELGKIDTNIKKERQPKPGKK